MAVAKAVEVRIEGNDYVMADGDVLEFRFRVSSRVSRRRPHRARV